METKIWVYADWVIPEDINSADQGLCQPQLIGELTTSRVRNKEHFSFSYDSEWLNSPLALPIDPELQLFSGRQFSTDNNFRVFLDSCPDRWGRLIMKRREAVLAKQEKRQAKHLNEIDYLLGVHDHYRMGGIRFKKDPKGDFLDNNYQYAAPPINSLRELEHAVIQVEKGGTSSDLDYLKWLNLLISPGSSLGGARPKASVVDTDNSLWIAKFPSQYDDHDIGAWEFVTYQLAVAAGIEMSECRIQRFNSPSTTP